MRPTNNIGFLLQRLAFVLARQSDQILQQRLGIGFSQFKILMVLSKYPDIQQRQIANNLGQTEASISRQIKLLLEQQLLVSKISPQNRRQHLTRLTPHGERSISKALDILNAFYAPLFDRLNGQQQEELTEMLNTMYDYVNQQQPNALFDAVSTQRLP